MNATELTSHAMSEHKAARTQALIAAMQGRDDRALTYAGRADGFMCAVDGARCFEVLTEVSDVLGDEIVAAHREAYERLHVVCEQRILRLRRTYAIRETYGNPISGDHLISFVDSI